MERIFSANYEPLSEYLIMPGQSDLNLLDTMVRRGSNIAPSFESPLVGIIIAAKRGRHVMCQLGSARKGSLDACCHAVLSQVEMVEVSCEHFPESTNRNLYCLLAFNDNKHKQQMGERIVKRAVNCLSALSQSVGWADIRAGGCSPMDSGISGTTKRQRRQIGMRVSRQTLKTNSEHPTRDANPGSWSARPRRQWSTCLRTRS